MNGDDSMTAIRAVHKLKDRARELECSTGGTLSAKSRPVSTAIGCTEKSDPANTEIVNQLTMSRPELTPSKREGVWLGHGNRCAATSRNRFSVDFNPMKNPGYRIRWDEINA